MVMPPVRVSGRRSRAGVFANMLHPGSYHPGWNEAAGCYRNRSNVSAPVGPVGFKGAQINALIFQRAPESLNHYIVHPAPFAIHRNTDVKVLLEALFEGFGAEVGFYGVGQPPGQRTLRVAQSMIATR